MTYEEAIKELEWVKKNGFISDPSIIGTENIVYAIDVAIRALEKQIPKKPVDIEVIGTYKDGEIIAIGKCPVCFEHIGSATSKNGCCNCLQALDWSVEE